MVASSNWTKISSPYNADPIGVASGHGQRRTKPGCAGLCSSVDRYASLNNTPRGIEPRFSNTTRVGCVKAAAQTGASTQAGLWLRKRDHLERATEGEDPPRESACLTHPTR